MAWRVMTPNLAHRLPDPNRLQVDASRSSACGRGLRRPSRRRRLRPLPASGPRCRGSTAAAAAEPGDIDRQWSQPATGRPGRPAAPADSRKPTYRHARRSNATPRAPARRSGRLTGISGSGWPDLSPAVGRAGLRGARGDQPGARQGAEGTQDRPVNRTPSRCRMSER